MIYDKSLIHVCHYAAVLTLVAQMAQVVAQSNLSLLDTS